MMVDGFTSRNHFGCSEGHGKYDRGRIQASLVHADIIIRD